VDYDVSFVCHVSGCSLNFPEARGVEVPTQTKTFKCAAHLKMKVQRCILASIAPSFRPGATPCFKASQSSVKAAANVQLQQPLIRLSCSRLCQCHRRWKVLVQAAAPAVEAVAPTIFYRKPVSARTADKEADAKSAGAAAFARTAG
jgi:hypothetical protein